MISAKKQSVPDVRESQENRVSQVAGRSQEIRKSQEIEATMFGKVRKQMSDGQLEKVRK